MQFWLLNYRGHWVPMTSFFLEFSMYSWNNLISIEQLSAVLNPVQSSEISTIFSPRLSSFICLYIRVLPACCSLYRLQINGPLDFGLNPTNCALWASSGGLVTSLFLSHNFPMNPPLFIFCLLQLWAPELRRVSECCTQSCRGCSHSSWVDTWCVPTAHLTEEDHGTTPH